MRTKKIFFSLLLLISVFFPIAFVQAAACTIREQRTATMAGVASVPACNAQLGEVQSDNSNCPGIKTNIRYAIGENIQDVCCCVKESSETAISTVPKFEIPELQIDLPGLNLTQPQCTQGGDGEYTCKVNWLGEYLNWIYNYAIKIAGILAAVMLMAGGLLWLVSGGDAGKVGQAKEIIIGSVTGLIILMSSYVILVQVNPSLVKFPAITLGALSNQEVTELVKSKDSGGANTYMGAGCATDEELKTGTTFYATGYCRPTWANTDKFFCSIAMNCSCPDGVGLDTSKNCDDIYKTLASQGKHYSPCKYFPKDTEYCNHTKSGSAPYDGSIAGPVNDCSNLKLGDQVCFNNKTYTITDSGGLIKGKRIDIWTGDCGGVSAVTGAGILTKGECGSNPSMIFQSTFITDGWSFDPGIINQASDASAELGQLLNCMRAQLPNGIGRISSISDSSYIGKLYECNVSNCSRPPCVHSCGSCHYGGGLLTNKSYAVDFGDEGNIAALSAAAKACDSSAYVLNEGNHLHVSTSACPRQ
ncbi:MAG: hypothetical protein HY931_02745 [Candidatus Falkowbacteria bacterium]|nr:MAG: hypothetical protein HY931_02745 [Candidatus Falkowbacteria bacterium]